MSSTDTTRRHDSSSVPVDFAEHLPGNPPYDPELEAVPAAMHPTISPITLADIATVRAEDRRMADEAVENLAGRGSTLNEVTVDTDDGAHLPTMLDHGPHTTSRSPLIYYIHGGGMMLGTRWSSYETFAEWVERYGAVVATLEYRLAPSTRPGEGPGRSQPPAHLCPGSAKAPAGARSSWTAGEFPPAATPYSAGRRP